MTKVLHPGLDVQTGIRLTSELKGLVPPTLSFGGGRGGVLSPGVEAGREMFPEGPRKRPETDEVRVSKPVKKR